MPLEVLLVEDQLNLRGALVEMVTSLGDFRIAAEIATEAEALEWLEGHRDRWDLAIVDLVLDQGSGLGVIRRCRETSPAGKVVVFSNFVTPAIRAHCLNLGADAAFNKDTERSDFADFCEAVAPRSGTTAA